MDNRYAFIFLFFSQYIGSHWSTVGTHLNGFLTGIIASADVKHEQKREAGNWLTMESMVKYCTVSPPCLMCNLYDLQSRGAFERAHETGRCGQTRQ